MNNSTDLVKKAENKKMMSIPDMITASAEELKKALPNAMSPERLARIALTCVRMNPDLAQCTPESFMGALFTSAQLGIEPVAGRAYLLPFWNKRKIGQEWKSLREVQFILGYKGVSDLFYRHAKSVNLAWAVVRENDDFDYAYGTESFLRHKPAQENRGKILGYWVMAKLSNGGAPFAYMTHDDCIEHGRNHSKTYDKKNNVFYKSSPWASSTESMCLKTVLLQLSKLLPMSVELQQAIQSDETSKHYRNGVTDILEIPDQTNWDKPEKEDESDEQ